MSPLDQAAHAADTLAQRRAASPDVSAQTLRSLSAAWQGVFEQRGGPNDGAGDAQKPARAVQGSANGRAASPFRLAAFGHAATSTAQVRSEMFRADDPAPSTGVQLALAVHRREQPVGAQQELATIPAMPRGEPQLSAGEQRGPQASEEVAARSPQMQAPAQTFATDSATITVGANAIELVLRDGSLDDEAALRHGFDVAAMVTGRRDALRRLTLNGREVYVRPSMADPQQPTLSHSC
jgi:hypothetical protein